MRYIFRNKLYKGTRAEIKDQLIIDLRDLLGFSPNAINAAFNRIPETYDIEIGIDTFSGTKEEILEQFIKVQAIAPIVVPSGWARILGVSVYLTAGEHACTIRSKVIEKVKGMIDEL